MRLISAWDGGSDEGPLAPHQCHRSHHRCHPTEDRYLYTRSHFEDTLAWSLGGHAAEQIVFGEMTTGAENDIERATKLARKMVMEYGMSDKLGPLQFGHKEEMVFLGRDLGEQRNYSEAVAEEIDQEVRRLITQAYARTTDILERYREQLDRISLRLVKEETLDGVTFDAMLGLSSLDPVQGVGSLHLTDPNNQEQVPSTGCDRGQRGPTLPAYPESR